MPGFRCHIYSDGPALALGLTELAKAGLTPRDLLFLALDPHGAAHLIVHDQADSLRALKVGEKLALSFPLSGPFYHFDSIHRLRPGLFLWNGDRRLAQPGNADDVAGAVTTFLVKHETQSVFFGCTPHHPGSWIGSRDGIEALHEAGFVEALPIGESLAARRLLDQRLWQIRIDPKLRMEPVFESPLGNVLLIERRVVADRLVLTCEAGLVDVDVSLFPWVMERARATLVEPGFAVLGRTEDVLGLEPFADKWRAFGWSVVEVDGHDHAALALALEQDTGGRPRAVIAHTTKGKGVDFMEDKVEWHTLVPDADQPVAFDGLNLGLLGGRTRHLGHGGYQESSSSGAWVDHDVLLADVRDLGEQFGYVLWGKDDSESLAVAARVLEELAVELSYHIEVLVDRQERQDALRKQFDDLV